MKHKKEISSNPVFRDEFLKMCKQIGVDPLASKKGFWVDVLGVGDFYFELAVSFLVSVSVADLNREYLHRAEAQKRWVPGGKRVPPLAEADPAQQQPASDR